MPSKERRRQFKEQGLCGACGGEHPVGFLTCERCRERMVAAKRRLAERHCCLGCGLLLGEADSVKCPDCRSKDVVRAMRKYKKRQAANRCAKCQNPIDDRISTAYCGRCQRYFTDKKKESASRKKADGICVRCPQPAEPGRSCCREHLNMMRDKARIRREKLRSLKSCIRCGEPLAMGSKAYCVKHRDERRKVQ